MKKLTKIIATIGPSSESEEMMSTLIDTGVNIFRFNIKHNDLPWHREKIAQVKKVADKKGVAIGTLIDLQGPEIRTVVPNEVISLKSGEKVLVGEAEVSLPKFNISHPSVLKHLEKGQKVVVEDGRAKFVVDEVLDGGAVLTAEQDQDLKTKKTFNLPGASYPMPVLTDKDLEAIKMAADSRVDFIALSFVRTAQDIFDLKEVMKKQGLAARVIPKIETRLALDNLDEIVAASEGLMVARGDLGIEIPMEQVPFYQKLMIKKCLERGIPVITATQMLISMFANPYPTRAEVSDIANAAYDFTDAVMLSEESAMGKYPEETVRTMAQTVKFTEAQDILHDTRRLFDFYILDTEEMMCDTAYNLYLKFQKQNQEVGGFIVFSQTGRTGRKVSRYRPKVPVYVFTPDEKVRDGLTMSFGVQPFVQPKLFERDHQVRIEDMKEAFEFLSTKDLIDPEKYYILLYGDSWGVEGGVSTVKVIKIGNKNKSSK